MMIAESNRYNVVNQTSLPLSPLLSQGDFRFIRDFVCSRSAIVLEEGKEYLVETRLMPVAKRHGLSSLTDLVAKLRSNSSNGLHRDVVEAMTTNETFFFRDIHPFEALKNKILPELINKRSAERKISIWCAACSTGQEPYSIGMLIKEHFPILANWKIDFVATDLASTILARAREGVYNQVEVNRGLPAAYLIKYFKQRNGTWEINEDIRNGISFSQLNLLHPWPMTTMFDIVFIRNVLIYFSPETKKTLLGRIRSILRPDGYLFLGSSESPSTSDSGFQRVLVDKSICYQPSIR